MKQELLHELVDTILIPSKITEDYSEDTEEKLTEDILEFFDKNEVYLQDVWFSYTPLTITLVDSDGEEYKVKSTLVEEEIPEILEEPIVENTEKPKVSNLDKYKLYEEEGL